MDPGIDNSWRNKSPDEPQKRMNGMNQFFQALSKTDDGAFIINEQRQIIFWNQAAQKILDYTADEANGRPCYEILSGRDEQGHIMCQHYCQMTTRVLQDDSFPNMDICALAKNGDSCWINMTTFALPTDDQSSGFVIVHLFRDITQNKSNEKFVDEIVAATRDLRNKNRGASFELTPLAPSFTPGFDPLTPRERQILLLLVQGLSTEEMTSILHISPATIRNHIQSILSKLNVHSRLEAVAYAYQNGLIDNSE